MSEQPVWEPDRTPRLGALYVFGIEGVMPCKVGATSKPTCRLSSLRTAYDTHKKLGLSIPIGECQMLYAWPIVTSYPHIGADHGVLKELNLPRLFLRAKVHGGGTWPRATEWFDVTPEEMRRAILTTRALRRISPSSYFSLKHCRARENATAIFN